MIQIIKSSFEIKTRYWPLENEKPFLENNQQLLACPECDGIIITDKYRGETICEQCGLIHSEKSLDLFNFDRNIFSNDDWHNKSSSGNFQSIYMTNINYHTVLHRKDINNNNFQRLAKWDSRYKQIDKRTLSIAMKELKRIGSNLRLPNYVRELAMIQYKKAYTQGLLRGREIKAFVCSCLYYACRKLKTPISIKDIIKQGCVNEHLVKNFYSLLLKEFNLKVPPLDPVLFVSRYINDLQLSINIEKKVLSVLQNLPFSYINGKEPKSIVGAIIYLICKKENKNITQKNLANLIGISEVSLRYKYKEIEKWGK